MVRPRRLHPNDITGEEYRVFMYALKKKKKWICGKCKWQAKARFKTDIIIHHINRNSVDNRSENLIVLCCDCHDIVHGYSLSTRRRKIIRQRKTETEERLNRPRRQYSENGWPI